MDAIQKVQENQIRIWIVTRTLIEDGPDIAIVGHIGLRKDAVRCHIRLAMKLVSNTMVISIN